MAISFRSASSATQTGISSVLFRQPNTVEAGDFLAWYVTNKYPTNGPNSPTGYSSLLQATGGAGGAGVDTGDVYGTVFSRIGDGTEDAATETVSVPSGNSATSRSIAMARSAGTGWLTATTYGAQNTAANTWSVTSAASIDVAAGDYIIVGIHKNSDSDSTHGSHSLSATGITFGTVEILHGSTGSVGTTQGDDCSMQVVGFPVTAGSGTVTLDYSVAMSGSAGTTAGVVTFVRLREDGAGPTPIEFTGSIDNITGAQGTALDVDVSGEWSGSETPFAFALTSGTLPAGVSVNASTGHIEGTPTEYGTFDGLVITATDDNSDADASNAFRISLSAVPTTDRGYIATTGTFSNRLEHTNASHSFFHDGSWWTFFPSGTAWNLYEEGSAPASPGDTISWTTPHLSDIFGSGGLLMTVTLDAANNKAYALNFANGSATVLLRVLTYAAGSWSVTQSVNLTNTGGVGLGTTSPFSNHDKLSIGVDANGVPLVFAPNPGAGASATNGCHIAWPDSAGSLGGTWSWATIDSSSTTTGDASGRFAGIISQDSVDYVVVGYTDDANEQIKFAYRAVQSTLSNYGSGWTTVVVQTEGSVDNHCWAGVMNYGGDQVVVMATKDGDIGTAGEINAFTSRLGASLTWTHKKHQVTNGPAAVGDLEETPSRPSCVLDESNGQVYVFYHRTDSSPYGWVGYKRAALADLLAASSSTDVFDTTVARNPDAIVLFDASEADMRDAKTPAHPITSDMGGYFPVSAVDDGTAVWWGRVSFSASVVVPGVVGTAAAAGVTGSASLATEIAGAVGAATAAGVTGSVSQATTIAGAVGAAAAAGVTGGVSVGSDIEISGSVGAAAAAGVTGVPGVAIVITGSVGTAAAAGVTASLSLGIIIPGVVGSALAAGVAGSVSLSTGIASAPDRYTITAKPRRLTIEARARRLEISA